LEAINIMLHLIAAPWHAVLMNGLRMPYMAQ
jgi:hypothetical protein